MEEINDVQALEKISSEVDESQIKVILSSQCIKAQAFLYDKLRRLADRHKETCNFISSANLKLEAEIKQADQENRSALQAQNTIKSAIVDIKKEWLLAEEKKNEVIDRITEGKNKYETLWLQAKSRYETIPFVKNLLSALDTVQNLNNDVNTLEKGIITIYENIEEQRQKCIELDKQRCIEFANYMINDMPKMIKYFQEKNESINELTKKIEELQNIPEKINLEVAVTNIEKLIPTATDNVNTKNKEELIISKNEDDPLVPKLKLRHIDFDNIEDNLLEVKIKKDAMLNSISSKTDFMENYLGKTNMEQYREDKKTFEYIISPYFKSSKEDTTCNFAKRKLINILEDVHIDNKEAYNMVKNVNPENLRSVKQISSEASIKENVKDMPTLKHKANTPIESEIIEEVDMTPSNTENLIIPPTQFLDLTLTDSIPKKRVAFELTPSPKINEIVEDDKPEENDGNDTVNKTINSQVSGESDESFLKIRDVILKKHNLDLTPEFVYAKTTKRDNDKVTTSKFFQNDDATKNYEYTNEQMEIDEPKAINKTDVHPINEGLIEINKEDHMDVDDLAVKNSKANIETYTGRANSPMNEKEKSDHPTTGLLFTHGTQPIPDSLNVSLSTTGYEEADFPFCIDSSLLLSPKGDIPINNDNTKVVSQEVPNFLTGFRKTGLSFFGGASTSVSKPEDGTDQTNGNNFNFNFGGEKKNRGGLFSLFQ